jgi:oligopeptidase B
VIFFARAMYRRVLGWICTVAVVLLFFSWSEIPIPVAKEVPVEFHVGTHSFTDNYLWLRNKESDPDVDKYIRQENRYTDAFMKKRSKLIKRLEREMAIEPKMLLGPCLADKYQIESMWQDGDYVYFKTGDLGPFPVYFRQKGLLDSHCRCAESANREEIVLDLNDILPAHCKFYMVGLFEVSQNGRYLAFSLDLVGGEKYSLYIVDLELKMYIGGPIRNTYYSGRWKAVQGVYYFYYNVIDERWQVPLYIDSIGPFGSISPPQEYRVYEEKDVTYICDLYGTNDEKYLFIVINGQITTEYIEVQQSLDSLALRVVFARKVGVKYYVEHHQGNFIIMTSENAPNYQVALHQAEDLAHVSDIVTHSELVSLEKMEVFHDRLVLWVRKDSFRKMHIYSWTDFRVLEYPHMENSKQLYTIGANMEIDMDARFYRNYKSVCMMFSNSSLSQPSHLYLLNRATMEIQGLMTTEHIATDYDQSQLFAKGFGNVSIPLSVISKRATKNAPLLITAYGAYGGFIEPTFSIEMKPFLNRC